MSIWDWFRTKLGIVELRTKNAQLDAQLRALSALQAELSGRLDVIQAVANTTVLECEERLLIRLSALEQRPANHDYTNSEEAVSPIGGFVPRSERKRQAELAASDPSKWTQRTTAKQQEK